ncbi:SPFH domain-containing protein [Planktothricoides sp. FACHB-1370]|nr:SPFH domain-containing protein [Planktothricoides raciborskii FACHB-1370]MBD2583020.1 SPFH domain-containing protein [Planktothricoides raciborskii FACHB-1261]
MQEIPAFKINGFIALGAAIAAAWVGLWLTGDITQLINQLNRGEVAPPALLGVVLLMVATMTLLGLTTLEPNQGRVLIFLGNYSGTVRDPGFWWVNPLASKELISLRVRNFNSDRLKVNDAQGNPIEIAAVVVWRVVDSAKALFDVEYYEEFVAIQSETAIRSLAIRYPYDSGNDQEASLRGSPDEVAAALKQEVQDRLGVAGVETIETRLSHLAYAPEIAQVMLRRQQAQAIIAARQQIVEGAVSMVEMAMNQLRDRQIIALDDDRKAKMINNLLVVLTSENNIQPVVNAGHSPEA